MVVINNPYIKQNSISGMYGIDNIHGIVNILYLLNYNLYEPVHVTKLLHQLTLGVSTKHNLNVPVRKQKHSSMNYFADLNHYFIDCSNTIT